MPYRHASDPRSPILSSECAPSAPRRVHRIAGAVIGGVAAAVMAGVALQPTLGPDVPNDDARMEALDMALRSRMLLAPLNGRPLEASAETGEIDAIPPRFLDEHELCRADPEEDGDESVDHASSARMRDEREALLVEATMTIRLVANRRF